MPSLAPSADGCHVGWIPQSVVEEWIVEMAKKTVAFLPGISTLPGP